MAERRKQRLAYVDAWVQKARSPEPVPDDLLQTIEDLERQLNFEDIRYFRYVRQCPVLSWATTHSGYSNRITEAYYARAHASLITHLNLPTAHIPAYRCLADVQLKLLGIAQPAAMEPVQSETTRRRKSSVGGEAAPATGGWFSGWWGSAAASSPLEPEEVFENAVCATWFLCHCGYSK